MTPLDLDTVLYQALHATRYDRRTPFRARRWALWLTSRTVIIGGLSWAAKRHDHRGYGYTRSQVKQMKRALKPVLAGYEAPLSNLVLAVLGHETAE